MVAKIKVVNYIENFEELELIQIENMIKKAITAASYESNDFPREVYEEMIKAQRGEGGIFSKECIDKDLPYQHIIYEVTDKHGDEAYYYNINFYQFGDGSFKLIFMKNIDGPFRSEELEFVYHCDNNQLYYTEAECQ